MKTSDESVDLRVRRTHKLLWDSLISLMTERSFESITVTDICERAMVHRTTFYKHYEDKYALLVRGIQNELTALFEAADRERHKAGKVENEPGDHMQLVILLEHILQDDRFYRLMLIGDGFSKFSTLLRNAVAERIERHFQHRGLQLSIPITLHSQLAAAAIVRMIAWWLENNYPYPPAEMIKFTYEHINLIG